MSDYKIKDINLAEFGRKEISLAETEMPGLMSLRKEYKGKKPNPKFDMDMRYPNDDGGWLGREEFNIEGGPASDEAKSLDGSYAGYQPKPAVEVVIVAMKPLEQKGYLDQALDNQKGVTWLDDCRIPFAGMSDKEQFDKDNVAGMMNFDGKYEKGEGKMYEGGWEKPNREGLSRGIQASRKTTKRKPREENTVFKTSGFKSEDNDTAEASPLGRFAANL